MDKNLIIEIIDQKRISLDGISTFAKITETTQGINFTHDNQYNYIVLQTVIDAKKVDQSKLSNLNINWDITSLENAIISIEKDGMTCK